MLSLLSTHWASRSVAVITRDDVSDDEGLAPALLKAALRRLECLGEAQRDVHLSTSSPVLRACFERGEHSALSSSGARLSKRVRQIPELYSLCLRRHYGVSR